MESLPANRTSCNGSTMGLIKTIVGEDTC